MATYLVFLRAVNLGATRKFPMAHLRELLTEAGYADVETHIQTGNIRLTSPRRSPKRLSEDLERLFDDDRGFEVPTVVLTPKELTQVVTDADELAARKPPEFGHYVELLREAPTAAGTKAIEGQDRPGQRAIVRGRAVHLLFDVAYHEAKGPNAAVKKAMGVSTNRNLTVIRKLTEKWG